MAQTQVATSGAVLLCQPSSTRPFVSRTTCHQHKSSSRLQRRTVTQPRPFSSSFRNDFVVGQPLRQQPQSVDLRQGQQDDSSDSSSLFFGLSAEQQSALLFLAVSAGILTATDAAQAADLQLLGALSLDKGQVIRFLVDNPFVLLGLAVALYLILPRLLRFTTRFILLPAAVAGGVYLVVTNPNTSYKFATTAFGYVTANPAIASGVILFALALALSPYVLVIGGAVLVFSLGSLPEPFKKLLPPPVAQAERSVDYLKQQAKGPTAQAASKLNSFKDSILGGRSKVLSPAHLNSARLLSAPGLSADDKP